MNKDIIELFGFFVVFSAVVVFVQWLLLRFTHWSVAIGATAVIAFVVAFLYVAIGHATPNGSGSLDVSAFITPMTVSFVCAFCELLIVAYFTKTYLPKTVLLILGAFITLFTIGRYSYQYIDNARTYQKYFSDCEIELINKSENNKVTEIAFYNSDNSLTCSINPNDNEKPYPIIPRDTDKLILTSYFDKKGMIRQQFPFNYSLCKEKDGETIGLCFWLRKKTVSPIKIVLNPAYKIDLYIDTKLVQHYQLSGENKSEKH